MMLNDQEKFATLMGKVLFAEYLDHKEKIALSILIYYSKNNLCRISLNALCDYCRIEKKSKVSDILKYLAKYKYINIIKNGNKTNQYEILDIDEAEEYAQECEEKQQSNTDKGNREEKDIIEKFTDKKDAVNIYDDTKEIDNKENSNSDIKELCYLSENSCDCSNKRCNDNKREITISCEDVKKIKVVAANNELEDISLILYSSDKMATTVFNMDRFRVEYRKLE